MEMVKWYAGFFLALALVIAGVWWYMAWAMDAENAIVKHDTADLRQILVDTPERASSKDFHGYTLMHLAAAGNFVEGLSLLASAGADVNASYSLTGAELESHKDLARHEGHRADYVVSAYQETEGMTPLHLAVIFHANGAVKELLRLGADVNALTPRRESPLHWAAKCWNAEAVTLLAAAGADVRAQTQIGGDTPMHAVFDEFPGAPSLGLGETFTRELRSFYYLQNTTPEKSRWKTIQALLRAGADPRQQNLRGKTAIDRCPPDEFGANFGRTGPAERDESINGKGNR